MKCLNRCLAIFLCIIMILSMPNTVFAVNSTTDSEDVQIYSVPIISNEYDGSHVTFYGIDGKYYLSFDDIKELARFELEETDTTITLTQGLRELVIEKSSGHLVDCDFVDQGNIDIIQYDGKYLCEGIPMLMYLGAACALKENQVLEVMMPTITIWESIMPDYLDYYFNITELYGGEDNVKISLACDIIADVLDGVSGHGLFANGDTHLEDALYEILNVDMMKYESVQESITAQNQSVNEFLASEGLSTFLDSSSSGIDFVSELLDYYADFYLDGEILKNEIRWQRSYSAGDLEAASDFSMKINQQVYKQSSIKSNINTENNISNALKVGMVALDTALTSYQLMQYDDDTRNLFHRTINEEMFKYTDYGDISWNNISDKISRNLSNNESIIQSSALNNIVDFAAQEVTEKGVQKALSGFTSKANIYAAAAQLGSFIASLINYKTNQAFSADMNAIWLNTVQYDIAQLTSRMLLKERDEYHFSDEESLKKLKDMFTLYYRTIIAFSENMAVSVDEFGGKNKNEWVQYFGGTSGKSVSNYAAIYLYRMTNCTIVPIVEYIGLSDSLITSDWINNFKKADMISIYTDFLQSTGYQPFISDWIYGRPSEYAILDIDGDGIEELIISGGDNFGFYNFAVFSYDKTSNDIYALSIPGNVTFGEDYTGNVSQYYDSLQYSPKYHALVFTELNNGPMFDSYGYYVIDDRKLVVDFSLWFEMDYETQQASYGISNSDSRETISQTDYNSYIDEIISLEWSDIPTLTSSEWKQAYIDYINEHRDQPMADDFLYKLVDINGDVTPELYVNYGTTAAGDAICTYAGGSVVEQSMWNYGFSYLEGQNRFRNAGGHMDVYYDKIYTIENGQFVLLCQGNYGASDNTHVSLDSNGLPIYTYRWNGTEVASEAEYTDLLHQAYDMQKAVTPFDGADFDSDAGRYVGNGLCNYEEILVAIRDN